MQKTFLCLLSIKYQELAKWEMQQKHLFKASCFPLIWKVWGMLLGLCRWLREVCICANLSLKCWHTLPWGNLCLWPAKSVQYSDSRGAAVCGPGFEPCQQNANRQTSLTYTNASIKTVESIALTCLTTELGIWSTKHISLNNIVWR